jgi:hypothetical protein
MAISSPMLTVLAAIASATADTTSGSALPAALPTWATTWLQDWTATWSAVRAFGPVLLIVLLVPRLAPAERHAPLAIVLAVAAGVYVNGGFGLWEMPVAVLAAGCAYRGLTSYRAIGLGWLVHTAWGLAHAAAGYPMLRWLPPSALECAVTDALLAIWLFAGAPDLTARWPTRRGRARGPETVIA